MGNERLLVGHGGGKGEGTLRFEGVEDTRGWPDMVNVVNKKSTILEHGSKYKKTILTLRAGEND